MNENDNEPDAPGPRPRGQLMRIFKDGGGFVSIRVYRNIAHGMLFYDTVCYRKVRDPRTGNQHWVRGPNFKPDDLPILIRLLRDADEYLTHLLRTRNSTSR